MPGCNITQAKTSFGEVQGGKRETWINGQKTEKAAFPQPFCLPGNNPVKIRRSNQTSLLICSVGWIARNSIAIPSWK